MLTIKSKIAIGFTTVLLLTLVLSVGLLQTYWADYARATESFHDLGIFRKVLNVGNLISAERGPANSALGTPTQDMGGALQTLKAFRAQVDGQLSELENLAKSHPNLLSENALAAVRTQLAVAREVVDTTVKLPYDERVSNKTQDAIEAMFGAVDVMQPLINSVSLQIIEADPGLAGATMIGRQLFELRDLAGRLTSFLVPSIASRRPLTLDELKLMSRTTGKIDELWALSSPYLAAESTLAPDVKKAEATYFNHGLSLVSTWVSQGTTGDYRTTTVEMTREIVPAFVPLERLRVGFIELMAQKASAQRDHARDLLLGILCLTLLTAATVFFLLASAHTIILKPLLQARECLVALASGRSLEIPITTRGKDLEISTLFKALNTVRIAMGERQELTNKFQALAMRDGLTGLLNRTTLDQIGCGELEWQGLSPHVGLIMMDIDHFKSVNDRFGHAAGDAVLKTVARVIGQNVRATDIVARYGGEEFAVIVKSTSLASVCEIANTLREAISAEQICVADNCSIHVTASFGVNIGDRNKTPWKDLMHCADVALYRAKARGRNMVCQVDEVA